MQIYIDFQFLKQDQPTLAIHQKKGFLREEQNLLSGTSLIEGFLMHEE